MKLSNILQYRENIFVKFILAFISAGVIPIMTLSFLSLTVYIDYLEQQTMNKVDQMLVYTAKNVESIYEDINNISQFMYTYKEGETIFLDGLPIYYGENLSLEDRVENFLLTILYSGQQLQNVFFVPEESDIVFFLSKSGSKVFDYTAEFPAPDWEEKLNEKQRELIVFPTHEEYYYRNSDQQVLTFARNWLDTSEGLKYRKIGTLYMDVSLDVFHDVFSQLQLEQGDVVSITDEKGAVIYSSDSSIIGTSIKNGPINGEYLYIEKTIDGTSWIVNANISKKDLNTQSDRMQQTIILFTVLCILTLIAASILYSRRLSKPIRAISQQMKEVESGNFDARVIVKSKDEIGQLAHGLNDMTEKLDTYIQEVFISKIKQKQLELNALKSQIRPHYLYNTLEVIRMSAVSNDDEEVADMIHALAKQLKYVISYEEDTVKLSEEIENVLDYFHLIKAGFEDRIQLDIKIEEGLLNRAVPKLSIQPIVENAFHHGLRPKGASGVISINAQIVNEQLVIDIQDNGAGMDESVLKRVRHKMEGKSNPEERNSVGLRNIHERIQTIFGRRYGLLLSSELGQGTTVRMSVPLKGEGNQ